MSASGGCRWCGALPRASHAHGCPARAPDETEASRRKAMWFRGARAADEQLEPCWAHRLDPSYMLGYRSERSY